MKIVIKDKFGNKFASFEVFNHHRYEETYIDLEMLEGCEVVGVTEREKKDCIKTGEVIDLVIDTRINLGESDVGSDIQGTKLTDFEAASLGLMEGGEL